MLLRILKKDLKHRKGVNLILFLFITLATVFLASSVNNILVISSAVDDYLDYAKVPDINIITRGETEEEQISQWLDKQKEDVVEYGYNEIVSLPEKSLYLRSQGTKLLLDNDGTSLYMATQDAPYSKVYNEDGESFSLEKGEMAMSGIFMEKLKVKAGDKLLVRAGAIKKNFTIVRSMKDAAFGNNMVGMTRLMVSKEDYNVFAKKSNTVGMYYVTSDNGVTVEKELNKQDFKTVMSVVTKDTYKMVYSFDMILAGLLILTGVCLILIALLVLRFTLVFTMEEAYQEIGIMKAIGIKNFAIKKIYLVKYLAIVSLGACLGFAVSLPVSRWMIKSISKNMIMKDSSANIWSNVVCSAAVIGLVLLFCYLCTKKLNRVSAVSAIRGGQTGERYGKRRGIRLSSKKHMAVPVFLGINDMTSHVKRYMVLMITFCISFLLITIPLNTVNTMASDEMVAKFLINPDSAITVKKLEMGGEEKYNTPGSFQKGMARIETELKEKGYDASLTGISMYFFKYWETGSVSKTNLLTIQLQGKNNNYMKYDKGVAPTLSNEVAFSQDVLEENKWNIGDSVKTVIDGKNKKLIITGAYSDYMQLGKSARLSPNVDCSGAEMFDYWGAMVDMKTNLSQDELKVKLKTTLPEYKWETAQDLVNQSAGGVRQAMEDILVPMTAMLCGLIMLITILMEKLFIVREKGEIAMMKSIGFRNKAIRAWQIIRMVCVVVISMVVAVPLSLLSNQFILKPIFSIMGADLTIQVVPWQVYGLYPGILLVAIVVAATFATRSVRKINIRELNNLE